MPETLTHLPNYLHDNTYFLSIPPERYENAIVNLKEAGLLNDQKVQGGYRKTLWT